MIFSFRYYKLFLEFCNAGNENELTFYRILCPRAQSADAVQAKTPRQKLRRGEPSAGAWLGLFFGETDRTGLLAETDHVVVKLEIAELADDRFGDDAVAFQRTERRLERDLLDRAAGEFVIAGERLEIDVPAPDGPCRAGLLMPDAAENLRGLPGYAIRCANPVDFNDGINWFGDKGSTI